MNQTEKHESTTVSLLSVMMFLQFFTWGAWFATLGAALGSNQLSEFIGPAYEGAPIAAIFAPLFLGLIADRLFPSEKIMGLLMLAAGGILCAMPGIAGSGNGRLLVWLILAHMACYMPTLGLGNTIAFTHITSQADFPKIRVWGTIGWIVAGLTVGALGWSNTYNIFWLGAGSAIVLGLFCFALPHTPPPLKGKPVDFRSLFMVDAFRLLADRNFLIFAACSTLICVPLAYYYGKTAEFLNHTGFAQSAATMTLGQMSEIIFMILIPFFFRRLGVKVMILIGMACWVGRYCLFAFGAPQQVSWMMLLGVALHGICYDFFFVTGFMYTDSKAPKEIRGQAQSLLVFLTQGIGMFFGFRIMAGGSLFKVLPLNLTIGNYGKQVESANEYAAALQLARGEGEGIGFFSTFANMFSRVLPEGLDQGLLGRVMTEWSNFWMLPAIMAAVIFTVFAVSFWDRMEIDAEQPEEA